MNQLRENRDRINAIHKILGKELIDDSDIYE